MPEPFCSVSRVGRGARRAARRLLISVLRAGIVLAATCLLIASAASAGEERKVDPRSVRLPNGCTIHVTKRVEVAVDPARNFHGPSVGRCPNGDLLLSHQDSLKHHGGDGFCHQWRSTDNGFTWQDEGPAADWRDQSIDSLFGEYGTTPDGRMVMMVQLRKTLGGNQDILNNVWYSSDDDGKTWEYRGEIDPSHKYAVLYPREIITRGGMMYFCAWSRRGNALYVSTDNGSSWQRRNVIFPTTHPDFERLSDAGPPFYPNAVFLPNGTLLAVTYITPPTHRCYIRTSLDEGHTWGPIVKRPDLPIWAPRLHRWGDVVILTGRDIDDPVTAALFTVDGGATWGHKLVVDRPQLGGNYAYTDAIQIAADKMWVFTSSPLRADGSGDILGVLLEKRRR